MTDELNEKDSLDDQFDPPEVKIVRLSSGEEIIADVTAFVDEDGIDKILVEKPALIVMQRPTTAQDRVGIGLVGWLPYSTVERDGIVIERRHVLFCVSAEDGLAKSYKERFTIKGLVLPQGDLLTGASLTKPSSEKSGLIL